MKNFFRQNKIIKLFFLISLIISSDQAHSYQNFKKFENNIQKINKISDEEKCQPILKPRKDYKKCVYSKITKKNKAKFAKI